MINGYERKPEYVFPAYGNVRADAKYLLSTKGCRSLLLFGAVLSCLALTVPIFIAYAIMTATPLMSDEYILESNLLFYASILAGIFLCLPGVYCGMYRVLLKISSGTAADMTDLFEFYLSPRKFFRSVGIFFRNFWFIFGFGILMIVSLIGYSVAGEEGTILLSVIGTLEMSYLLFGTIIAVVTRKYGFIFVPYAIENEDVSLRECSKVARSMRFASYREKLSGDFGYTLGMVALSLLTIGILFVAYTGPMMMSRKVCFYRNNMINKFRLYQE